MCSQMSVKCLMPPQILIEKVCDESSQHLEKIVVITDTCYRQWNICRGYNPLQIQTANN
jgi:hypothetical protein